MAEFENKPKTTRTARKANYPTLAVALARPDVINSGMIFRTNSDGGRPIKEFDIKELNV